MTPTLTQDMLRIHVFGGTSDALHICRQLEQHKLAYSLSVATPTGQELAVGLRANVVVQRMDAEQMALWLDKYHINCVIDATHPFASEASRNILAACQRLNIPALRFERPQDIDALNNALLIKVDSVEEACERANALGKRVLLTTGSKQLADYIRLLPNKELIARVLPTVDVMKACYALGLGVGNIVALKGPFSAEMNLAMYRFYQPDVVITKESGAAGGYKEKVQPCLESGIPCIIIRRPVMEYQQMFSSTEELIQRLLSDELKVKQGERNEG